MRVLITGGCGFVARELTAELEAQGHELVLVDRQDPATATMFNPMGYRETRPLETRWPLVQAEITDAAAMQEVTQGTDAVIHLAAWVNGLPEDGVQCSLVNAHGTFVMIDAARRAGVKRFFCASSINAFGTIYWRLSGKPSPYTSMPLTEDFEPVPEDPYSLTKHYNELTCAAFSRGHGMTTAAFRFAGVWTPELYEQMLKDGLKSPDEWQDTLFQWVHVKDLVRGIRQALEKEDMPAHGVYTLGGPDTICPEPTMELLQRLRPDLAERLTEELPGRAPLMSITRARKTFGYDPQMRLGP